MFLRPFRPVRCLAFGLALAAQQAGAPAATANGVISYSSKRFTTEDGLPQNTIRFLAQSRDGYLWVGTSAGVARYDGVRFKVYYNEFLRSGQEDTRVWDLGADGDDRIWVRPGRALACFDHGNWSFFDPEVAPLHGSIGGSRCSSRGGIWLNISGELKLFKNGTLSYTLPNGTDSLGRPAYLVGEDLQGNLWMGFGEWAEKPRFQRLDVVKGTLSDLSSMVDSTTDLPDMLLPSRSGGLWLCGTNQVARLQSGTIKRYAPPPGLGTNRISYISEDQRGALWFTCDGISRVFHFSADENCAVDLPELPSRDVRCILAGQDGVVWVGTGDQGLIELRPRAFSSILNTNPTGEKTEVYCLCEGAGGRLWFGTSQGLFRLEHGAVTKFTNSWVNIDGRIENSVRSVLEDKVGNVWLSIRGEGLKQLRGTQFVSVPQAGCGTTNQWMAASLIEDPDGSLWIGSDFGLIKRTPDGKYELSSANLSLAGHHVAGVCQSKDGAVWFGTDGAGLFRLFQDRVQRFRTSEGLSSDYAVPLCIEEDGTVWIACPNGLNRLRQGKAATITTRAGLLDDELYSLVDDGRGFYWASCNRGIFRIPKHDLHAVADGAVNWASSIFFGEADGMPSTECNGESQPNAILTSDGHLWFSTTRGCCTTDPGRIGLTEEPPPVVIEEILADNQLIFREGALTPAGLRVASQHGVRFPAGHARVMEIRYTGNSFLNPKRVSFAHRLKGHDELWADAGSERVAFYTDISPGTYSFEVKARNEQGAWSPSIASFDFSVARHFWQTWYFYAICIVGCVGIASAIQGYRLRWQHRLLKLEEQQALANERARIARDLHDDLGTALTGLALQLDVARRKANGSRGIADRIAEAAGRARDLANRMREVVWTINPRCDTVAGLASFLEEQVSLFAEADGIKVTLDLPEDIPTIPMTARSRHELALSVREALTNVIRHSKATEIVVTLELTKEALIIEVKDNGCGFEPTETPGHGLSNMRIRIEQVGGNFECSSLVGGGTVLTFKLPLEH